MLMKIRENKNTVKTVLGGIFILGLTTFASGCRKDSSLLIEDSRIKYVNGLPKEIQSIVKDNHYYVTEEVSKLNINKSDYVSYATEITEVYEAEKAKEMKLNGDLDLRDKDSQEKIKNHINDALKEIKNHECTDLWSKIFDKNETQNVLRDKLKNPSLDMTLGNQF